MSTNQTEILEELNLEEFEEMERMLTQEAFEEQEDRHPELMLLNKVSREKLGQGFGEFINTLAQKVGPETPIKIGESYAYLIITPLGVQTLCGYRLKPQDQFGIRLFELLQLLIVDLEDRDTNFKRRLQWEVNRAKGALQGFGRTTVAKKLSQSGRQAVLLVNRASEDLDPNILVINEADSKEYFLDEGCLVLVARYPGSSFSTHMVITSNLVPEGTVYTSTKALLSHQGDTDGDTVILLKVQEA